VHLLALSYSLNLKKYGFEPVLEKFVHEMNELSRVGFEGNFPIIGKHTIYASLCQVTCDNLALNSMLGFIESFSCDYFCTLCYATQSEIKVFFREEQFKRRTMLEYTQDTQALKQSKVNERIHVRGVKTNCKLNEIDGFHVKDNWSLDVMHIVLAGIVPLELGCILYSLCKVDNVISLEDLNAKLELF